MKQEIKYVIIFMVISLPIVAYLDKIVFGRYWDCSLSTYFTYFTKTLVEYLIFLGGIYCGLKLK